MAARLHENNESCKKEIEVHDVVYKVGGVAQLGEHLPCKQGVKSSNLSVSIRGL